MTNPNDPVHPTIIDLNPTGHLTKREFFAALAMQGFLACPNPEGNIAILSVDQADALIIELNKDKQS